VSGGQPHLVDEVAAGLGVRVLRALGRGGSGAHSVLTETGAGELAVLKIVTDRPGAVDGHDLASFLLKSRQIQQLRQRTPAVGQHYPPVLATLDGPGWASTLTRYVPGSDLVAVAGRDGPGRAHELLRGVWHRLSSEGYAATSRPASAEHWLRDFCDRLERRRNLLVDNVAPALLNETNLTVNGREVPGFDQAAATARDLAWVFDRSRVADPVHGDLNLRNIVIGDPPGPPFALVDPRGTLGSWDPVYDLAKVLFSLTVFDDLMEGGARIGRRSDTDFTVAPRGTRHGAWLRLLIADLDPMLEEAGITGELALHQLLLAHATHVLAESACRISDLGQRPDARRESAAALLLFGLILMADLADAFGAGRPLSATRHLSLLEPRPAGSRA